MEPLVSVEELAARMAHELKEADKREALQALEYLSASAKAIGHDSWTFADVPEIVRTTIIKAASRYLKNYEDFKQSRAGDETLEWFDRGGGPNFTDDEKESIATVDGARVGLYTAGVYAWGDHPDHRYHCYCDDWCNGKYCAFPVPTERWPMRWGNRPMIF